jgi:hypothetical protein
VKASVFIGTSVDGFIARANGDLDFLPPGGGEPHGYEEFMATVELEPTRQTVSCDPVAAASGSVGTLASRFVEIENLERDAMTSRDNVIRLVSILVFVIGLVVPRSDASQQPEIATTVAFTEGPAVDREGNVYFTDIINQRIMKLGVDGVLSTYRQSSNVANGLLIDPEGRLIACEGAAFERPGVKLTGTPRVTRTDLKTGTVELLADSYEGKPLVGPNDITIDGRGRLYFTLRKLEST